MLVRRKAEHLHPVLVHELRPCLAVCLLGAFHFGNALADDGVRDDEVGLARSRLGFLEGGQECLHVVAVLEFLDLPSVGFESPGGVGALRFLRHGVQRHQVRIVNQDQVIEPLMPGEFRRLVRNAFLHAAVARQADHVVVENLMPGRVESRRRHFFARQRSRPSSRCPGPAARSSPRRPASRRIPGGPACRCPVAGSA